MTLRFPIAIASLLLVAASCATAALPARSELDHAWQEVHVENSMPVSFRVVSVEDGNESLLGRVPAAGAATFRLRSPTVARLQLIARPAAGLSNRQHVSEPIQIMPGQRVTWLLRYSPGTGGLPQMSTFRVVGCGSGSGCE